MSGRLKLGTLALLSATTMFGGDGCTVSDAARPSSPVRTHSVHASQGIQCPEPDVHDDFRFVYRGPGYKDYQTDREAFDRGTHTETLADHLPYTKEIPEEDPVPGQYIRYTFEHGHLGMGVIAGQISADVARGYQLTVYGMLKKMTFQVSGNWPEGVLALRVYVDEQNDSDCPDEFPVFHNLVVAEVKSLQPGKVCVEQIADQPRCRTQDLKDLQQSFNRAHRVPDDVTDVQNMGLVEYPTCAKRIKFLWELARGYTLSPEWNVRIDDIQIEATNIYVRKRPKDVVGPWLVWPNGTIAGDWILYGRGSYELGGSGYLSVRWEYEEAYPRGRIDPALITILSESGFTYVASGDEFTSGALYPLGFYMNPYFRLIGPNATHLGIVQIENREHASGDAHYNLAITNVSCQEVHDCGKVFDSNVDSLHTVVMGKSSPFRPITSAIASTLVALGIAYYLYDRNRRSRALL